MSYLDWHVGMKVVCVEDQWVTKAALYKRGIPCPLVKGRVYTIKAFTDRVGVYGPGGAPINVILEEVERPKVPGVKYSAGFNAARFRPVQTRKTDISIFNAMLTKTPVDA